MSEIPSWIEQNKKVSVDGSLGFVRYIGPLKHDGNIADPSEIWVGIQWQEANRGKHNGTVQGYTYFACEDGKGSLVKLEKIDTPKTVLEALVEKYQGPTSDITPEEELVVVDAKTNKTKKFELVGMDKIGKQQSQLDRLHQVILSNAAISQISKENSQSLGDVLKSVEELDISDNLFTHWKDIFFPLAEQLPSLKLLNISGNKIFSSDFISSMQDEQIRASMTFSKLEVLILNSCDITWKQVQAMEPCFPNLREIHLNDNELKHLDENVVGFQKLAVVDLQYNKLEEWKELLGISKLPSLAKLILSHNLIKKIDPPNENFVSLKSLSISSNQISEWHSINALDLFPQMDTLRFSANPLLENLGKVLARQVIIARIAKLKMLNGTNINNGERVDSERFYLKYTINTYQNLEEKDFHLLNPRFKQLEEAHGTPKIDKPEAQTIADEMITIFLMCPNQGRSMMKTLPASLTVSNLKTLCHRLFFIEPSEQVLYFKKDKSSPIPDYLDQDNNPLYYYGVHDKTEIIIESQE